MTGLDGVTISENEFHQLKSIYPVSRETLKRLDVLVQSVQQWQPKTNLVSPSTIESIWTRHVADSLQCLKIKPDANRWLDVGSGGGFPGLVIAAVMAERSPSVVHLVESNHKKVAFLRQTARKMNVPVKIHQERIESVAKQFNDVGVVTARAFAPLKTLLDLIEPVLEAGATGLFHKGREYSREIEECNGVWSFDLVDHKSSISDDSVLLEISNLRRV